MFRTIVMVVVVLLAAILIYAATKPSVFRYERSILIKAASEKIFALINDFHQWHTWSPYEGLDPAMQRSFSGAVNGPGAIYSWQGNSKAGAGSIAITNTSPPTQLMLKLDMLKPIKNHNTVEFVLQPRSDAIHVSWIMYGPVPYVSKLAGVFFNMDRLVGGQFEAGLANLKRVAEVH